ncbi:flagellar hook-associated protein FlgL [Leeia oryzae]|uniref:flagellar hook-associated protein FlgL n=1 Tax=Leeia oryzae TaxID=356662 RepID=UPI00039BCA28|nr:flagellar hook-associated protein FlgL [Leeia oryzae]
MRLSSLTMRLMGEQSMSSRQLEQMTAQQQLSSGRRILTPSDDPVAAARALNVQNSKVREDQFSENSKGAADTLRILESQLTSVSNSLSNLQDLAVQAGNGALSDANLKQLATAVEGRFREILGLANSQGADGQYLFSGYQGQTQPFLETASTTAVGTVSYQGDQGIRQAQISESRVLQTSETGDQVFGNMFSTLKTLHDALINGKTSPTYQADLQTALTGLKTAQDQVTVKISAVGTRQNEIDAAIQTHGDLSLQYETEHSNLVDVDYAASISKYMQAQQLLEVSRTTFKQTQGLSLFNYLS